MLSMCSISLFLILLNILDIQNEDAISQAAAFCGRRAALEEMAEVAAVKLEATRPWNPCWNEWNRNGNGNMVV